MQSLAALLSGIIAGLILCQSIIVAPLIFKTLPMEHARPLLRSIFPMLFKLLLVVGVLLSLIGVFVSQQTIPIIVGAVTALLAASCLYLIPMTNHASDAGDQAKFKSLHKLSVLLTLLILLLNLSWVFA